MEQIATPPLSVRRRQRTPCHSCGGLCLPRRVGDGRCWARVLPSTGFHSEEFVDNLKHPDPVPLELLLPRDANPAAPADSNVGSGCGQQVSGASPVRLQGDMRRRREDSLIRSTQPTDRPIPRRRVGQRGYVLGVATTPCRSRMSALEQSFASTRKSL